MLKPSGMTLTKFTKASINYLNEKLEAEIVKALEKEESIKRSERN